MYRFVGIDNSSTTHFVQIIDESGEFQRGFSIANKVDGFKQLDARLGGPGGIRIGLELTHGPLVDFLRSRGYAIYGLNPLKVKRYKQALVASGDKNDKVDALALAKYMQAYHSQLRPMVFSSPEVEKLKLYCITHERLTSDHARYKNRLRFVLRQYFPLFEELFTDISRKVALKLLQTYPTWEQFRFPSDEELTDYLKHNKYRRTQYIKRLLDKRQVYRHCIAPEVEAALAVEACALASMLQLLQERLEDLEQKMTAITKNHKTGVALQSLPGAGALLASRLLGLLGDNKERYDSAAGLQALLGTAPQNYQSGSYHRIMMRRACNKRGRALMYQFAFCSLQYCSWAKGYYKYQRMKGKTNSVAIRALSNKWTRIVYKIWLNETKYQPDLRAA